jgi:hypothetical protein
VQTLIEAVGVPTVQQWRNYAYDRGWLLNQPGSTPRANPHSTTLIPLPEIHGTAHYKFFGRQQDTLTLLLTTTPAPAVVYIFDDDNDNNDSFDFGELSMH